MEKIEQTKPRKSKRERNPTNSTFWTKEECHERTVNKYPRLHTIQIPREIVERLDLNPTDKLIYGLLTHWRGWVKLRLFELAGIIGISPYTVTERVAKLEKKGLIERVIHFAKNPETGAFSTVAKYRAVPVPRVRRNAKPTPLTNDISDINQKFKEFFNEIDLDS